MQLILLGKKKFKYLEKLPSYKRLKAGFFRFFAQNDLILMELGNLALIKKTSPHAADTFGQKKFKKS